VKRLSYNRPQNINGGKNPRGKVKFLKGGAFPRNVVPQEGDITRNFAPQIGEIVEGGANFLGHWDEVKSEGKLKLSTCLHEIGTKITKFSIYSLCQAILVFRWLLLAYVVPMSRIQPRPV
jgi:hypothetical protein